jgi:hypothetical protein
MWLLLAYQAEECCKTAPLGQELSSCLRVWCHVHCIKFSPHATRTTQELGAPASAVINGVPSPTFNDGHPDPNLTYAEELVRGRLRV